MTTDSTQGPGFLRQDEMNALIAGEKDPITADLMAQAAHIVVLRVLRKEKGPISDFDLCYFMEIVQEFARDQDILRSSLNGRENAEDWLTENDI